MKYYLSLQILLFTSGICFGQSKTTDELQKKYSDSFALFFYNNTLRMINQSGDKEFDELIRDIEKMKFLIIRKTTDNFNYKQITSSYKKDEFEEIMTSRHEGKNFDIYIKEEAGETKAMLALVNDKDNLYVLDILGKIPLDKITKLYHEMDKSSDISKRIQNFVGEDNKESN